MTPTLIDQLKLAIQVESGEVPLSEVERRLNADYISTDNSRLVWHPAPGTHTPKHWNFREYEYRRKPKPFECEVWVLDGRIVDFPDSMDRPLLFNGDQKARMRMIKMREVTND